MTIEPESIRGKRVVAFAGIARPEVFKASLIDLGAEISFFRGFRDHHPYTMDEILGLRAIKEKTGADMIITTEKDWIRLEGFLKECPDMAYLTIRFKLISGRERLFNMIREKIGDNRP